MAVLHCKPKRPSTFERKPPGDLAPRNFVSLDKSDSFGTIVTVYQFGKPIRLAGPSSCAVVSGAGRLGSDRSLGNALSKDALMRIPHWPALVCGWMLAAT